MYIKLYQEEECLKREIRDIRRRNIQQGICQGIVTILDNLSDAIPMPKISYSPRDGWRFYF